jgi:hypothetical protein
MDSVTVGETGFTIETRIWSVLDFSRIFILTVGAKGRSGILYHNILISKIYLFQVCLLEGVCFEMQYVERNNPNALRAEDYQTNDSNAIIVITETFQVEFIGETWL